MNMHNCNHNIRYAIIVVTLEGSIAILNMTGLYMDVVSRTGMIQTKDVHRRTMLSFARRKVHQNIV